MKITCLDCKIVVETKKIPQPGQDQSTFRCIACQDKLDLPQWKAEEKEIKKLKDKANTSQLRRLAKVGKKIKTTEGP